MFHLFHETCLQLLNKLRRNSDTCKQKYILIEEDEHYFNSSHTLIKMERKKGFQTNTMKPMSAHDERTLDTACAMANEITTKSMNDLDGDTKLPNSPSDRSKFHFKFPQLHLHNHQTHESEKDAIGKHAERRNFSEEANSVPDIQSTLTEESKLAYTSLIENPSPASSLMSQMADANAMFKPATIPKPAPRALDSSSQFHSLQKPTRTRPLSMDNADQTATTSKNELPLPPRSTKPKLVDKPRHIRKHPLKLPTSPPPQLNRPIIYQNALTALACIPLKNGVDVCDGIEKEKVDTNTNPFTSNSANPFNCYIDDVDCGGLDYNDGSEQNNDGGLIKDCSDHVSVEDLLEFADQKPCGRQRGVESDEVRVMSKVLKQQVTPEQCLQALDLIDWDVHHAIKVVRVRTLVERETTLEQCAEELTQAGGDVAKAAASLSNKDT